MEVNLVPEHDPISMIVNLALAQEPTVFSLSKIEKIAGKMHTISFNANFNHLMPILKTIVNETYCSYNYRDYCISFASSLGSLYNENAIKPIIDIYALDILSNRNSYILIEDKDKSIYADAGGIYNVNSNIEIASKHYNKDEARYKGVIIHEMTHSAMNFVFKNGCNPYKINDHSAKNSFEQAEKDCLQNIYKLLKPGANLPINQNSWSLGIALNKESASSNHLQNLPYENKRIINKINELFDEAYQEKDNHLEFIVRYYQLTAEGISKQSLKVFNPLIQYIKNYVNPVIEQIVSNSAYTNNALFLTRANNGKFVPELPIYQLSETVIPLGENDTFTCEA